MPQESKYGPELASWLGRYDWTHALHLTTRHAIGYERLLAIFRDRTVRKLSRIAQQPVPWFAAAEQTYTGRYHLHALIGGTLGLTLGQIEWCWRQGFSRIVSIYDTTGAAAYATKLLDRQPDQFEFSPRLPRLIEDSHGISKNHDGLG